MRVVINGQPRQLEPGATLARVVEEVCERPQGRGVAVAVDGEVVPRGDWPATRLCDGDRVEIVVAVQGG